MKTITQITAQKKSGRYNIFLDKHYAFPVSEDVLIRYNLHKGLELTDDQQAEIAAADVIEKAYQLALNYLSYQIRTIKEMRQYLKQHEVESVAIEQVIDRLKQQQYLDDGAYAIAYVQTNKRLSLKGPQVIRQELRQKGVMDENLIVDALTHYDQESLLANGQKLAQQIWQRQHHVSQRIREQKVRQGLQQKGYSGVDFDLIWSQLDLTMDDAEEHDALQLAAAKAQRHYQPLTDRKQRQKFTQALYRKGFAFDAINNWLADHEQDE
ncbi:recombination regulator RecX [Lapidilactobacillus wuchangensis]|uniref:recombination regulator RecX n=1 Tax=Lapidilactobacillus wuchangensis TaxID=2486001 RepID=UPI000F79AA86|nr:recombination regulator RecX [Lapidilactobacillus wuchangensis]